MDKAWRVCMDPRGFFDTGRSKSINKFGGSQRFWKAFQSAATIFHGKRFHARLCLHPSCLCGQPPCIPSQSSDKYEATHPPLVPWDGRRPHLCSKFASSDLGQGPRAPVSSFIRLRPHFYHWTSTMGRSQRHRQLLDEVCREESD